VKKVKGFIDGYLREFAIYTPVDEVTVEKILRHTAFPKAGVYVIQHPPTDASGRDFYREFRERNPGMMAYVGYTTFETDSIPEPWVESCNSMDEIWVPSHFNLETFSRAGVLREKIHVIPHGFDPDQYKPDEIEPLEIGTRKGFNFLSIFEWTHRKGWDVLIRAYLEEFRPHEDVRLIIRAYQGGGVVGSQRRSVIEQLTEYIISLGYDPDNIPDIEFIERMIPAELMPALYRAADAFVLPTRGEGWGIPLTESMLMEVPVIATRWGGQLEFMNNENSYLIDIEGIVPVDERQIMDNPLYRGHRWAEPSVKHTRRLMRHVFENREEARQKGRIARQHIVSNFTIHHVSAKIAERLIQIRKRRTRYKTRQGRNLKVLFQARGNIFTQPGGDTDVMLNIKRVLEEMGITVDFSENPFIKLDGYDLVHIFNFDTPFAINASLQCKPYIVTPMYEDLSGYFLKSLKVSSLFKRFLETGDSDLIDKELSELQKEEMTFTTSDLQFIASNASAILVTGKTERDLIIRDFPEARNIKVVPVGFNRPDRDASPDPFIERYNVRDFVLCVGRLETRKNQLMLLHALRDVDIPIVFINSRTIQPEYEEMCRRYRRKGRTIFTGRLPRDMLFSAYRAARVHALPSWFELPGIVTLEAGWMGCNVVATDCGTIRDYLGDHVFYCEPHDPESIKRAVLSALQAPPDPSIREVLSHYTWEGEAEKIKKIYNQVLSSTRSVKGVRRMKKIAEIAKREKVFHQLRGKALQLSKSQPEQAVTITKQLLRLRHDDATLHFILGMAFLYSMNYNEAERFLKETINLQPAFDINVYLYLTLALMKQNKHGEAINVLEKGLERHPFLSDRIRSLIHEYRKKAYDALGINHEREITIINA